MEIAEVMRDRNDRLETELEIVKKVAIEKNKIIDSLHKKLDEALNEIADLKRKLSEQMGISKYWMDNYFQMKKDNEQLMATPFGVGTSSSFSRSLPSTAVFTFPSLEAELRACDDAEQLNSNAEQKLAEPENKQFLLHLLIFSLFGLIMIAITLPCFLNTSTVPFSEQNSDTSIMSFSSSKDPAYSSMFNSSQWLDNEVCPASGGDLVPFDADVQFNSNNEQTKDSIGIAMLEEDTSSLGKLKFTGDFSVSPTPEREDNLHLKEALEGQRTAEDMLDRAELFRGACKFASRIKQQNSATNSIVSSGRCKFFSLFSFPQQLGDEDMLRANQDEPEELVDDGVSSLMEQIWS
uniref:RH2 domain-containing protein n=1 Tax=Globodera pallida TaxID=36090 RepID=A0A183CF53_GLOPA